MVGEHKAFIAYAYAYGDGETDDFHAHFILANVLRASNAPQATFYTGIGKETIRYSEQGEDELQWRIKATKTLVGDKHQVKKGVACSSVVDQAFLGEMSTTEHPVAVLYTASFKSLQALLSPTASAIPAAKSKQMLEPKQATQSRQFRGWAVLMVVLGLLLAAVSIPLVLTGVFSPLALLMVTSPLAVIAVTTSLAVLGFFGLIAVGLMVFDGSFSAKSTEPHANKTFYTYSGNANVNWGLFSRDCSDREGVFRAFIASAESSGARLYLTNSTPLFGTRNQLTQENTPLSYYVSSEYLEEEGALGHIRRCCVEPVRLERINIIWGRYIQHNERAREILGNALKLTNLASGDGETVKIVMHKEMTHEALQPIIAALYQIAELIVDNEVEKKHLERQIKIYQGTATQGQVLIADQIPALLMEEKERGVTRGIGQFYKVVRVADEKGKMPPSRDGVRPTYEPVESAEPADGGVFYGDVNYCKEGPWASLDHSAKQQKLLDYTDIRYFAHLLYHPTLLKPNQKADIIQKKGQSFLDKCDALKDFFDIDGIVTLQEIRAQVKDQLHVSSPAPAASFAPPASPDNPTLLSSASANSANSQSASPEQRAGGASSSLLNSTQ